VGGFLSAAGGGAIGGGIVTLYLNATQYEEQLAATEASTGEAATGMGAAFSKLGMLGTAAFVAIGIYSLKFIHSAISDAEAYNKAVLGLNVSLANSKTMTEASAPAFIAQATAISNATGVYKENIIAAMALNVQQGLTADQVRQLTPLIVDVSQKLGIEMPAAAKAVGKAVEGSSGSLSKLGITIDKTAYAADHYGTVLKALGGAQGYATKLADEEPWLKLGNAMHNLATSVGEGLIRMFKDVATALSSWAPLLKPIAIGLEAVGAALAFKAVGGFAGIASGFSSMLDVLEYMNPVVLAVGAAIIGLTALFTTNANEAKQWASFTDALTKKLETGAMNLARYNQFVQEATANTGPLADTLRQKLATAWVEANKRLQAYEKTQRELKLEKWAQQQEAVLRNFGHMTSATLKQWKSDWNKAAHDVVYDLSNTSHNMGMTKQAFINGTKAMEARAKQWAQAMHKLQGEKWVPPGYLEFLQTQGPGAITAFASLTKTKQEQMVGDWKKTNASFDTSRQSLNNMTAAVQNIPTGKVVDIGVHYHYVGYDPSKPFQGGG
jgi:hypothetical protein